MESVTIHIATKSRYARVFIALAKLLGGAYRVEKTRESALTALIDEGEQAFADGKGKILTIDELRALTDEVA